MSEIFLPLDDVFDYLRRHAEVYCLIDRRLGVLLGVVAKSHPELAEGTLHYTVRHVGEAGLE